ncbi:hypothetical protein AB0J86_14990 [Micromonospora sp. NPDC049559]|uniref:hypothetical protein n=1 Tax=Micromonospora sp. NPDC049559 TaxID=3155923 RepID=UPI0034190601
METIPYRFLRIVPLAVLSVLWLAVSAGPAAADTPSYGGDVQVAQTLGDRELTLVLRRVTTTPGPLRLDVITHAGSAAGSLRVALTPTGAAPEAPTVPAGVPTSRGAVTLGAVPGSYGTTLWVDRPGPWELAVDDGQRTARVPFVVLAQATAAPERTVYGGFLVAGALLVVSLLVAVRTRRGAWALVPAGGVVAALSTSITAAMLSASLPLPPQPGVRLDPTVHNAANPYAPAQPLVGDYSRPPVLLSVPGPAPVAGRAADLTLDLTDGATGLPVDDLVVHDGALVHLLMVGPSGQLWHAHPVRIAPGVFQLHVTPPRTGHYALSVELVRRGGGVQVVRSPAGIDVITGVAAGPTPAPPPLAPGYDATAILSGTPVTVRAAVAVAGSPTTLTARIGDTNDLQPWLGMLGHLVVVGPLPDPPGADVGAAAQRVPVWAHAHSMGDLTPALFGTHDTNGRHDTDDAGSSPMDGMDGMAGLMPGNGDSAADETVAAYGPGISFTYTFPQPGHYRVWIQAERQYRILTMPADLTIAPGTAGRR